jgi:hypothetical protein
MDLTSSGGKDAPVFATYRPDPSCRAGAMIQKAVTAVVDGILHE